MTPAVSAVTSYDEVRYRTLPLTQTNPDRLATVATLLGMRPRPVARCRVLEIGCGDGGNLIPLADAWPESRFVGFDLAGSAVARGTAAIRSLGLTNVELRHQDIMDVTAADGVFDYVIAHGVYSWVPAPVRDRLLAVCKANLAPDGVAYVSYNTYPGCHIRQAARAVLQFHVEGIDDPEERIRQARALARFIADTPPYGDSAHFQDEMRSVLEHTPGLLFHDDLAAVNDPVYFHEFVRHAHRHGLQFLAEANVWDMQDRIYPEEVIAQLRRLSDGNVVLQEQYLDFLKNRRFRQTLLCHDGVVVDHVMRPAAVERLLVASSARTTATRAEIAAPSVVVEFGGSRGASMSTDHRLAKAAMFHLAAKWPRAVALPELAREGRAILGDAPDSGHDATGGPAPDVPALCDILINAYAAGVVELFTCAPSFTLEVSDRPTASRVARLQAERGDDFVATLRHGTLHLEDPLARHLLCLLDGTRTRADLLREMQGAIAALGADATKGAGESAGATPGEGAGPTRSATVTLEGLERKLV
ncbi:MAG TPA: class I SAM-dependent methyltransferase, partial [Miltoncostaea sp.]|nr:class I SAM-dependent methyltransferase [Miltoncostaea sp.]